MNTQITHWRHQTNKQVNWIMFKYLAFCPVLHTTSDIAKNKNKNKKKNQNCNSANFFRKFPSSKALPITSVLSLRIQQNFFCCFMAWCRFFSYWAFYTASLAVTLVLFWVITVWKGRHLNGLELQKRSEGGEFYISARNSSSTFPITPPSPRITPNSIAQD